VITIFFALLFERYISMLSSMFAAVLEDMNKDGEIKLKQKGCISLTTLGKISFSSTIFAGDCILHIKYFLGRNSQSLIHAFNHTLKKKNVLRLFGTLRHLASKPASG
jgi:hypothetical protein